MSGLRRSQVSCRLAYCRERRAVTVFLMNGFQIRGYITGFDAFIVVVNTDGKQQFIYKHAISTITPEHPISLYPPEEG